MGRARRVVGSARRRRLVARYLRTNQAPWTSGYYEYRQQFIASVLQDEGKLSLFRTGERLPVNFGFRLDGRSVEIPWVLSRLPVAPADVLDAGSSLNHAVALDAQVLQNKKLTIVTLAPEREAAWQRGISYVYGDLRQLYFADNSFDAVACVSTLEHVGMDNRIYATGSANGVISRSSFKGAAAELWRVLRPGGTLFLSVPFGRYEDHGWFQQFDDALSRELVVVFEGAEISETVYRYTPMGWQLANRRECADCRCFDVHMGDNASVTSNRAAAEEAVLCIVARKRTNTA